MEICVQPKITCSTLMAHQGIVLVRSGVELCRDKPQSGDLVGVCVPDGDGPKLPRAVTIEYHHGRKCWHIKVEHSRQQRNEFLPGNLPDLIRKFEEMFHVTLPAIQVRHLGVGFYAAALTLAGLALLSMPIGLAVHRRLPMKETLSVELQFKPGAVPEEAVVVARALQKGYVAQLSRLAIAVEDSRIVWRFSLEAARTQQKRSCSELANDLAALPYIHSFSLEPARH